MRTSIMASAHIVLAPDERFDLVNPHKRIQSVNIDHVMVTADRVRLSGYRVKNDGTIGHTRATIDLRTSVTRDEFRVLEESNASTELLLEIARLGVRLQELEKDIKEGK